MNSSTLFLRLSQTALALAMLVVVLGAYVRLSDAGLGCPDWPGCYGQLIGVPEAVDEVTAANQAFPERPVEAAKAWKEMLHRYLAGALGLIILVLAILAIKNRKDQGQQVFLPILLLFLVIGQALLGMWTVTLLLKPAVVTAHLLGGFLTLSGLLLLVLRQSNWFDEVQVNHRFSLRLWATIGMLVLFAQITLGAWTSTNYAALACTDFPACQGQYWPESNFDEAFKVWRGLGTNYEYGVLEASERRTIHLTHRLGAAVTVLILFDLLLVMWLSSSRKMWLLSLVLAVALLLQVSIGIAIVLHKLPLPLAVAHNGGAALLLLAMVMVNHAVWRADRIQADSANE